MSEEIVAAQIIAYDYVNFRLAEADVEWFS
jgi:hypothetical protein